MPPSFVRLLMFGLGLVAGRLMVRGESATLAHRQSRALIHSAGDAIIATDAQQRIVLANPAAATMFGTTVQQMQGAPLSTYIAHGNPAARAPRSAGRRAADYALTGFTAAGEHLALEGSRSTIPGDGQPIDTLILRDITERRHVQAQLEHSYAQLRQLSAALQTVREEERTHIARELHDDLGQLLAALRLDLTLLRDTTLALPEGQRLARDMDGLIVTAIASLRRIAGNLRPRALDDGGLYFALRNLHKEFTARHAIAFELQAQEAELALDDAYSTAIYRIVQEALTNIARHAQAQHVTVALTRQDGSLALAIRDDGKGIQDEDMDKAASFGLLGIRERVWALHGTIAIDGGQGTRIDIALPLRPPPLPA